jgi:hypothetical protein
LVMSATLATKARRSGHLLTQGGGFGEAERATAAIAAPPEARGS